MKVFFGPRQASENAVYWSDHMSKSIVNIRCCAKACDELDLPYQYHDKNGNFLAVERGGETLFFVNTVTPFNNQVIGKICHDKEFTYRLLKDVVNMPKTIGYLYPDCEERYQKYVIQHSNKEIADNIEKNFAIPLIVKKNSGARGANVFSCESKDEILAALKEIFNKDSHLFDYIALAQEKINFKKEFRIVVFQQEIELVYEKDISGATFNGNLSPLHYEDSRAVIIRDQDLIERIRKFIEPVFAKLDIVFAGFDIMLDQNNKLWLIEINTNLGFEYFARDNGEELLIDLYKKMLMV